MDKPEDIDALSFAASTAQAAAAKLYGLMAAEDQEPIEDWIGTRSGDVAGAIEPLAKFITGGGVSAPRSGQEADRFGDPIDNPETVWRQAVALGVISREAPGFEGLPFARRLGFRIFTSTAVATFAGIRAVQKQIEDEVAARAQAANTAPLAREDSIDEAPERLDALIPGVKEAAAAETAAKKPKAKARPSPGAAAPPSPASGRGKTRSIGETKARVKGNEGGRGKKKSSAERRREATAKAASAKK